MSVARPPAMTKLLNVRSEYEEEHGTFRSNRWNQSLGRRKGSCPRSTIAVGGTERVPRRFTEERRSGSDFRRRYSNVKEGLEVPKEANCRSEHGLTDAQAEKFWPVYEQYTSDLVKINDTKAALIQEYIQTYDTMTGDQPESYLRKRAAVEESIMQLRVKYVPVFRRVLSGRETALFFQIDWRLGLMIDLQLAQLPLINP